MIFASTSCLKGRDSRFESDAMHVLEAYRKLKISNIELGAAHSPMPDIKPLLKYKKETDANFICHANFPPSGSRMMLNMCSQGKRMQSLVLSSAKKSIELLNKLEGNLFSTHFGYTADVTTGWKQMSESVSPEKALDTGAHILGQVCDYAKYYNINVAVETLPPVEFCILVDPKEFRGLFKKAGKRNLGVLIDIGHILITEQKLGIKREEFAKLQENALEFHVHQVANGVDHQKPTSPSIFNGFEKSILKKTPLTLEATGLSEKQVMESLAFISRAMQ